MQQTAPHTLYRASEFAALTGVTVRTLHHYDRLGLLRPSGYSAAGYRLYSPRDFARLQQVVTLKFIGFSLKQIKELLVRTAPDLPTTLRRQRALLEAKRRHLDTAINAIAQAEQYAAGAGEPARAAFQKIIEVINMQQNTDWMKQYYTDEAQQKLAARAATIPREQMEQVQRDWVTLIAEVEAAVGARLDPASAPAQALAARWAELLKGFTGGDPEIQAGLNKLYADQANWPASSPRYFSAEVCAFIQQARAAGAQS